MANAVRDTADASVVLSIDQGTTGTTALIIDRAGNVIGRGYREVRCDYPRPGWVETNATDLWARSLEALASARDGLADRPIAAIGIANQRETTVLWNADSGAPATPAIVWQCRRTVAQCDELRSRGLAEDIASRTGLVIDPYFSATKLRWLLDDEPDRRSRAASGELKFGTVDSWLLWNLTGGQVHRTEVTNASRTMLYNIFDQEWDPFLLDLFDVPRELLPEVHRSGSMHGMTVPIPLPDGSVLPAGIPIAAMAGDQQAALYGQACFEPGMAKCTYGTGAFLLLNNGTNPVRSRHGLITTMTCGRGPMPSYALEGSVFIAGAAIQWLRDQLGILRDAAESEDLALEVGDTGGVYLVPAFVGLGAPYWDDRARGIMTGLSSGTGRAHLARAALEAIAYQTRDVIEAMAADAGSSTHELRIDGGASSNNFLCQFQADILDAPVVRPRITETTGMGAGLLAGLVARIWRSEDDLARLWQIGRRFEPTMSASRRESLYAGWLAAVDRARSDR